MNIAVTTRSPVHTANVFDDPRVGPFAHQMASAAGYSAFIHVPLARHDTVIGLLTVNRREAGPFAPGEIGLLQTFADQAVIAIENVRLFNETREALEQQEASAEVLAVISSSVEDTAPVFERIMDSCEKVTAFTRMAIFLRGDDDQVNLAAYRDRGPGGEAVAAALRATFPQPLANTPMALAFVQQRALFFGDVLNDPQAPASLRLAATRMGNFSVLVAPMLWEGRGIGAFHVGREAHETFSDKEVALLKTFTDQAVIAIQNARLFQEIADKSQQLEAASQHKSEFLANMSHELRTPLNAILGFSEVLAQGMFGAVNEKQIEYLHDILESGRHLLSLINDILDLSKIEAGRMELEVSEFDLPQAIQNALTLVRERALRRGIGLHHAIDSQVAAIRADERKVKQVLLNLLSNAIKFTPEGGRIEVRATPADGLVEVSVADTGVGIAPEDLEAVFEEFRQVGTADKKAEGTGLGLALAKKFVELHGGRIWVESAPGRGSTFTFMLPIQ